VASWSRWTRSRRETRLPELRELATVFGVGLDRLVEQREHRGARECAERVLCEPYEFLLGSAGALAEPVETE
jgi:hypothetical protein